MNAFTFPFHPVTPAQRNPRPSVAGSWNPTPPSVILSQRVGRPRVGTGWLLSSFTLEFTPEGTVTGPNPAINNVYKLVIGGRPVATFTIQGALASGVPITQTVLFPNPFPIFDTEDVRIEPAPSFSSADFTITATHFRWWGSVAYL